jgi:hypothetical protein
MKGVNMSRIERLAVMAILLLSPMAQGKEAKIHFWPMQYVPQEAVDIPVVMDVGFWIHIVTEDAVLKLAKESLSSYAGCVDIEILANFDLTLSASIEPTGAVFGKYSTWIERADIDQPGGTATVCARLEDAGLLSYPGGQKDVHVATVTVKVVPRF